MKRLRKIIMRSREYPRFCPVCKQQLCICESQQP